MEKFSKKRAAKQLFVEQGFEAGVISNILKVASNDIKEWAYREKWQHEKESNELSNVELLRLIMEEFKLFLEQKKDVGTKLRLDTLNAYRATIAELKNGGVSPIEAVQLCNQLNDHFLEVGEFDIETITDTISAFLNKYYLID